MAPRFEVITSRKRFAEIKPNWDALWRRCKADVFRTHAWIATWLESSRGSVTPRIAVAWQGDDIVAAIPLVVRRGFGLRTLEWPALSVSDYCDALALPEAVSHLSQLWTAVWQVGRFDLVNLDAGETGRSRAAIARSGRDGSRCSQAPRSPGAVLRDRLRVAQQ